MGTIGQILSSVGGIGMLVCFILLIVQLFQRGRTGLGILCIVLFFCCTIGHWIAYIVGWMNSRDWGNTNLMWIWTVFVILWIIGNALVPPDFAAFQRAFQQGQIR